MIADSKRIIASLSFLMYLTGYAQKKTEKEIVMTDYYAHVVTLSKPVTIYHPVLPLTGIRVFDTRFDTVSSGLIANSMNSKEKLIHFNRSASVAIEDYFKSHISLAPPDNNGKALTLVCFIKKLFLSDFIYIDNNNQVNSKSPNYDIKSGVMTLLEFYANQDENFIPLYRFDTTVTGEKDVSRNSRDYLEDVLTASLRRLETLNWEKIRMYSKPKARFEVDSFNNSRFNIPILKESPRKGLYLNFEHFRNNTPVDSVFSVEKTKKGDYLYVKNQKGEEILQTDLWGYCDGKDIFIFGAENYFKLSRYGNTFIVYGAKDFTSTRRLRMNFGLIDLAIPNSAYSKNKTANSYSLVLNLLQLDMESGELY